MNQASAKSQLSCPTCNRKFELAQSKTPPFCCERCQLIDLGRWLQEDIGLPFEGNPEGVPVEFRDEARDDFRDEELGND